MSAYQDYLAWMFCATLAQPTEEERKQPRISQQWKRETTSSLLADLPSRAQVQQALSLCKTVWNTSDPQNTCSKFNSVMKKQPQHPQLTLSLKQPLLTTEHQHWHDLIAPFLALLTQHSVCVFTVLVVLCFRKPLHCRNKGCGLSSFSTDTHMCKNQVHSCGRAAHTATAESETSFYTRWLTMHQTSYQLSISKLACSYLVGKHSANLIHSPPFLTGINSTARSKAVLSRWLSCCASSDLLTFNYSTVTVYLTFCE